MQEEFPFQDPKNFYDYTVDDQSFYNVHRNSFFGGLIASYNYNDTILFRFSAGITSLKILQNCDRYTNADEMIEKGKYKQENIYFTPGIVGKLTKKKILFFAGAEIPFCLLGKSINTGKTTDLNYLLRRYDFTISRTIFSSRLFYWNWWFIGYQLFSDRKVFY